MIHFGYLESGALPELSSLHMPPHLGYVKSAALSDRPPLLHLELVLVIEWAPRGNQEDRPQGEVERFSAGTPFALSKKNK